jgi:hypothetical protein
MPTMADVLREEGVVQTDREDVLEILEVRFGNALSLTSYVQFCQRTIFVKRKTSFLLRMTHDASRMTYHSSFLILHS